MQLPDKVDLPLGVPLLKVNFHMEPLKMDPLQIWIQTQVTHQVIDAG